MVQKKGPGGEGRTSILSKETKKSTENTARGAPEDVADRKTKKMTNAQVRRLCRCATSLCFRRGPSKKTPFRSLPRAVAVAIRDYVVAPLSEPTAASLPFAQ